MVEAAQYAVHNATWARYGNPDFQLDLHNRSDLYHTAHYDLRLKLDEEGMLDPFVVVDENTLDLNAVWFIESTEYCKLNSDPKDFGPNPPIVYPGEDFILWQAHMLACDVPTQAAFWDVSCGDLVEYVINTYWPYDTHDPQDEILALGVDWSDPSVAAIWGGFVPVEASWMEVQIGSTHLYDRESISPTPRVVVRLTDRAAEAAGLIPQWYPEERIARVGEDVQLHAYYDWKSGVWPHGYPDLASTVGEEGVWMLPGSFGIPGRAAFVGKAARKWNVFGEGTCARLQRARNGIASEVTVTA